MCVRTRSKWLGGQVKRKPIIWSAKNLSNSNWPRLKCIIIILIIMVIMMTVFMLLLVVIIMVDTFYPSFQIHQEFGVPGHVFDQHYHIVVVPLSPLLSLLFWPPINSINKLLLINLKLMASVDSDGRLFFFNGHTFVFHLFRN